MMKMKKTSSTRSSMTLRQIFSSFSRPAELAMDATLATMLWQAMTPCQPIAPLQAMTLCGPQLGRLCAQALMPCEQVMTPGGMATTPCATPS